MRRWFVFTLFVLLCATRLPAQHFAPSEVIEGIGEGRRGMDEPALTRRIAQAIEAQTFIFMRNPEAVPGAERCMDSVLQALFEKTAVETGVPKPIIEAMAWLESFCRPDAVSPTGPKGIYQISRDTGDIIGLVDGKRKARFVRLNGKKVKVLYIAKITRDDRGIPEKAIPAAMRYLAGRAKVYGRWDLAIFSYHCGPGCVDEFRTAVQQKGITGFGTYPPSVGELFFLNSPTWNRPVFNLIQKRMAEDWSPTYWFRVQRAQELLHLYRTNPAEFNALAEKYRNQADPTERAPNRLWTWYSPEGFIADFTTLQAANLVPAWNHPHKFGFSLRTSGAEAIGEKDPRNRDHYLRASKAAVGALAYIAFEVRRLSHAGNHTFAPLDVTGLVRTLEYQERLKKTNPNANTPFATHCTGEVFDISYKNLTPKQREILRFVLDDLGYKEMIGFFVESKMRMTFHVGVAPSAKEFFERVYHEGQGTLLAAK